MKQHSLYQETLLNQQVNEDFYSRQNTILSQESNPLLSRTLNPPSSQSHLQSQLQSKLQSQSLQRSASKEPKVNGFGNGAKPNGFPLNGNGNVNGNGKIKNNSLLLEGLELENGVSGPEASNTSSSASEGFAWRTKCILWAIGIIAFWILLAAIAIVFVIIYFSPTETEYDDLLQTNSSSAKILPVLYANNRGLKDQKELKLGKKN